MTNEWVQDYIICPYCNSGNTHTRIESSNINEAECGDCEKWFGFYKKQQFKSVKIENAENKKKEFWEQVGK